VSKANRITTYTNFFPQRNAIPLQNH
jgi:hypothetical protein